MIITNINQTIDKESDQYKFRNGYYRAGSEIFRNRTAAMAFSKNTGKKYKWYFNENVFGNITWKKEINIPLNELYRLRAQQLRNNYDYLILNFSGGIDSLTILHAFIDNNIFLDEIVIQKPINFKSKDNVFTSDNYWSEIDFQALPYIRKIQNQIDSRTKIRIQDIYNPIVELLQDQHWYEKVNPNCNLTLSGFSRIISGYKDPDIINLAMKGLSVGRIYGAEKPRLSIINNGIYAYFTDLAMYMHNAPPSDNESKSLLDHHQYEPFYWTPYLPEITIKQSQVVAAKLKSDLNFRNNFLNQTFYTSEKLISPLIYEKNSEIKWKTDKVTEDVFRTTDNWFWQSVDQKTKDNFLEVIKWYDSLGQDDEYIDGKSIMSGMKALKSRYYLVDTINIS